MLHGKEQRVYGDSAYASQKQLIASKAPRAKDFTNQRARFKGFIDAAVRAKNRNKSRIRARVENVFGVVKRLWGFGKERYRGLQKNATQAFTALALANMYLGRKSLLAQVRHEPQKQARRPAKPAQKGSKWPKYISIWRNVAFARVTRGLTPLIHRT